jgi:hypothetical protein
MTSIFAQLFLDIQQRIAAECPDIHWIDQDLGQDQSDTRPPVAPIIESSSSPMPLPTAISSWNNSAHFPPT